MRGRKRKRNSLGFDEHAVVEHKRFYKAPPNHDRKSATGLLDLPPEVLIQVFISSASSAFPETCKFLYEICYAAPRVVDSVVGPPLWLQRAFVEHTNPTLVYAVNRCLRRRFFGPETLKSYLPELRLSKELVNLSIPLRLVKPCISTRELLLFTELFLAGIQMSRHSRQKGLIFLASQATIDANSLFWKCTANEDFDDRTITQAFKVSARKRSFGRHGSFAFLAAKFSIDDNLGNELYEMAARSNDQEFIHILRQHRIQPGLGALRILHMTQGMSGRLQPI